MTLQVNKKANWQATVSRFGGVVVLPTGGSNAATIVDTQPQPLGGLLHLNNQPPGCSNSVCRIGNGTQLLIRQTTFNLRRQRMGSVNWLVPHHSYQCPD